MKKKKKKRGGVFRVATPTPGLNAADIENKPTDRSNAIAAVLKSKELPKEFNKTSLPKPLESTRRGSVQYERFVYGKEEKPVEPAEKMAEVAEETEKEKLVAAKTSENSSNKKGKYDKAKTAVDRSKLTLELAKPFGTAEKMAKKTDTETLAAEAEKLESPQGYFAGHVESNLESAADMGDEQSADIGLLPICIAIDTGLKLHESYSKAKTPQSILKFNQMKTYDNEELNDLLYYIFSNEKSLDQKTYEDEDIKALIENFDDQSKLNQLKQTIDIDIEEKTQELDRLEGEPLSDAVKEALIEELTSNDTEISHAKELLDLIGEIHNEAVRFQIIENSQKDLSSRFQTSAGIETQTDAIASTVAQLRNKLTAINELKKDTKRTSDFYKKRRELEQEISKLKNKKAACQNPVEAKKYLLSQLINPAIETVAKIELQAAKKAQASIEQKAKQDLTSTGAKVVYLGDYVKVGQQQISISEKREAIQKLAQHQLRVSKKDYHLKEKEQSQLTNLLTEFNVYKSAEFSINIEAHASKTKLYAITGTAAIVTGGVASPITKLTKTFMEKKIDKHKDAQLTALKDRSELKDVMYLPSDEQVFDHCLALYNEKKEDAAGKRGIITLTGDLFGLNDKDAEVFLQTNKYNSTLKVTFDPRKFHG